MTKIKMFALGFVSVAMMAFAGAATAAPIYLGFTGTGASGNVAGNAFTNQNWRYEFALNPSTPCHNCADPEVRYENTYTSAKFYVGNTAYTLTGGSATGTMYMSSRPGQEDRVAIGPNTFGFVQFSAGYGQIFPALFDQFNSLSTANFGTTVFNSTAGVSPSMLFHNPTRNMQTTAGLIEVTASTAATGLWSLYVSSSEYSPSSSGVPAPGALALLGLGLLAIAALRRRKAA
jgi:hypothetical protein